MSPGNPLWDDSLLGIITAKIQWLKLGHTGCNATYQIPPGFYDAQNFPNEQAMEQLMRVFGQACAGVTQKVPDNAPDTLTSVISQG